MRKERAMMIKSSIVLLLFLAALGSITGCSRLPGKPSEKDRWIAPSEVADFDQLYSRNCAGCHGSNGRMGAARPLNDPLYLSIASADSLREVTRKGVTGTAMPPFSIQAGGNLTDKQIDLIVGGMRSRWGRPDEFNNVSLPPYSLNDSVAGGSEPGDPQRGLAAYNLYCADCHGPQGKGGKRS